MRSCPACQTQWNFDTRHFGFDKTNMSKHNQTTKTMFGNVEQVEHGFVFFVKSKSLPLGHVHESFSEFPPILTNCQTDAEPNIANEAPYTKSYKNRSLLFPNRAAMCLGMRRLPLPYEIQHLWRSRNTFPRVLTFSIGVTGQAAKRT